VRLPPSEVAALLEERERASSTAISPTVAIPHVVLPGENAFDILLARCRKGIRFSDAAPNVRAVFVFVGTGDERNFHLRALAAVAQIVQDSHFEKRWAAARGVEELRDLVLLAERRRR
jgi:mannitol/fructose-specific phosphotransferase system IIA component (Ntr-type)